MLPKAGYDCTQGSYIERNLLREAAAIFGEYYQRERNPAAYEPIYPGRGSVWFDKERLWIPEILNNREEECTDRAAVPGAGVQSQKEVDEAAKKKA